MDNSYPTLEPLKFLLQMIHNQEMALPDFQRDFVWDPYATDELIESIIQNFPAGTLLRIKNGKELLFQPRAFEGAPVLSPQNQPSYLILDGQQRLTSLYQAFYGCGEHRYYLNLQKLEQGLALEDCAFYMRTKDGEAMYGSLEQQARELVFPMQNLFGVSGGFSAWQNEVLRACSGDKSYILNLQEKLSKIHDQWIQPVEEYRFPMVTLNEETSAPAVCMIFETLNRTGIKLGVFDLLTARFWPKDFNMRMKWDEAKDAHSMIEEYKIDPYYLLQIIAMLEPGLDKEGKAKVPSIKRGEILNMKVEQARRGWDAAVMGLKNALLMLRDDCGILDSSLIPYNTIIVPMSAILATQTNVKGPEWGANRIKIQKWFWCSVFGQHYENAPNSQAEKDFGELKQWLNGGVPPESVRNFNFDIDLRQVGPRQRAVYKGVMALILKNGAMDFYKRGKITSQLLADKKNPVDDHHIFPRAFCDTNNMPVSLRDCILNRTYIDRETNHSLNKRKPSDYFREIRDKQGKAEVDDLFKSHAMPIGDTSPVLSDNFNAFLEFRHKAISEMVRQHTT
ncbi:MAG TPA: DUF262 domain-containing protein [bacterium]|nr:DUF262 domain-containing protein [bacterium]